jgi:hypothetical protein
LIFTTPVRRCIVTKTKCPWALTKTGLHAILRAPDESRWGKLGMIHTEKTSNKFAVLRFSVGNGRLVILLGRFPELPRQEIAQNN